MQDDQHDLFLFTYDGYTSKAQLAYSKDLYTYALKHSPDMSVNTPQHAAPYIEMTCAPTGNP